MGKRALNNPLLSLISVNMFWCLTEAEPPQRVGVFGNDVITQATPCGPWGSKLMSMRNNRLFAEFLFMSANSV